MLEYVATPHYGAPPVISRPPVTSTPAAAPSATGTSRASRSPTGTSVSSGGWTITTSPSRRSWTAARCGRSSRRWRAVPGCALVTRSQSIDAAWCAARRQEPAQLVTRRTLVVPALSGEGVEGRGERIGKRQRQSGQLDVGHPDRQLGARSGRLRVPARRGCQLGPAHCGTPARRRHHLAARSARAAGDRASGGARGRHRADGRVSGRIPVWRQALQSKRRQMAARHEQRDARRSVGARCRGAQHPRYGARR